MRVWPLVVLATSACGGGGSDLDDVESVRTWANAASAVAVFVAVYDPIAASYDQPGVYPDPACPVVADDGTTLVITGGCTDSGGRHRLGSATVVRQGSGDRQVTLEAYGDDGAGPDVTIDGTAAIHEQAPDNHSFALDYVQTGGMTITVAYDGTVNGFYDTATTVWSGHGTVAREGLVRPTGTVDATTVDQTLDSATCSGESVSGSTTLRAGGDEVVVTYDGATDCDEEHSARWTFNGADRGLVSGVQCAVSLGAGDVGGPLLAALALAVLLMIRRPRRGR